MKPGQLRTWAVVFDVNGTRWQVVNLTTCRENALLAGYEQLRAVFDSAEIAYVTAYTQVGLKMGARILPKVA